MEWNEKEQTLKAKRRWKVPLRISPAVNYVTLHKEADQKWKNFHSNLYDESQAYHLLFEDGSKAQPAMVAGKFEGTLVKTAHLL